MDESGILGGTTQRFFCLGLMKMRACGALSDSVHRVYDRAISCVRGAGPGFEFKFNAVTTSSLPFHLELVDAFFAQPEYYFCAFVMDKERPGVNWQGYFGTVWDAYLSYATMVVKNNIQCDQEICVIADYVGKPRRSRRFFESEIAACVGSAGPRPGRVFNACMLDSNSSLLIQTVDLIVGGVRHSFVAHREPGISRDDAKDAISARICSHLGRSTLATSFTNRKPRYFSVWEFVP